MRVFKFGGAGICSADRIKNLLSILQENDVVDLLLVVSAMGKTTNKLENVLYNFLEKGDCKSEIESLFQDFNEVCKGLFPLTHIIFETVESRKNEIFYLLKKYEKESYNFLYDQVVPQGELITSEIIVSYLQKEGIDVSFLDARSLIKTNSENRDASVDWDDTEKNIQNELEANKFYITQGFIASDSQGNTTTLGREGSDYTAAIFAYCMRATELIIWKDVDGVLNADPRYFENTTLLEQVSFHEAIELAYYGASIIHPKTIQPLHSRGIPLRVRSFSNMESSGTVVNNGKALVPDLPCYILKQQQQLLQISSRNFSFIVEDDISEIFKILCKYQMKVNLLHNSAISLSLCIDDRLGDINMCIDALQNKYKIVHTSDVTLYTIRNFKEDDFLKRFGHVLPLLKQTKDDVMHFVVKDIIKLKSEKCE